LGFDGVDGVASFVSFARFQSTTRPQLSSCAVVSSAPAARAGARFPPKPFCRSSASARSGPAGPAASRSISPRVDGETAAEPPQQALTACPSMPWASSERGPNVFVSQRFALIPRPFYPSNRNIPKRTVRSVVFFSITKSVSVELQSVFVAGTEHVAILPELHAPSVVPGRMASHLPCEFRCQAHLGPSPSVCFGKTPTSLSCSQFGEIVCVCESAQEFQYVDETGRVRVGRGGDDDASSVGKCAVGSKTIKLFLPVLLAKAWPRSEVRAPARLDCLAEWMWLLMRAWRRGQCQWTTMPGATVRMTTPQRPTAN
jgi:hypothetical protein